MSKVSLFSFFPFLLFLLATEGNFLASQHTLHGEPTISVTKNLIIYGSIYFLAFVMLLMPYYKNARYVLAKNGLPLLLIVLYMLAGFFWTISPVSVTKEVIHFIGIIAMGALAAESSRKIPLLFFSALYYFSLTLAVLSVLAVLFVPEVGIGINDRWQGVTSHPNHLGITCMIGIFAVIALLNLKNRAWWRKFPYLLAFLFLAICLIKANSMTCILLSFFFIALIPASIIIINSSMMSLAIIKISIIYVFVISGVLIIYVVNPELLGVETFFSVVGRSRTLTGRFDLWLNGWDAFLKQPLFGWGFDNLVTLTTLSPSRTQVGQFHNGYVELLVRGGIIGILLVSFLGFFLLRNMIKTFKINKKYGVVFFIFLIIIFVHNLTETSIMQFPNTLWALTIYIYFFYATNVSQKQSNQQRTYNRNITT